MSGVGQKSFQINNLAMHNTISSMKYEAKKSIPGLADAGVPHVDGDGPVIMAPGSRSKKCCHHTEQHKKLKGLGMQKTT